MATPPTFATGDVLTAAQMNAVGLWLVKSQAVGSGVSTVTVSGAFSADYDNYKIIYSGGVGSTTTDIQLRLGASATTYNYQLIYSAFGASALSTLGTTTGTAFAYGGGTDTNAAWIDVDLLAPYLAKYTYVMGGHIGSGTTPVWHQGLHKTASSYTDFTIFPSSGTLTGGTISVYGYRK